MQDRTVGRWVVVACVLSFATWGTATARAGDPSRKPQETVQATTRLQILGPPIDLIYIPKGGGVHEGRKTRLFRVLMDGKGPKDGFFEIHGKLLAPVWKSSDPSVLKIHKNAEGTPSFTIRGPGAVNVTVSVGDWSGKAHLTVSEVPFRISPNESDGISRHNVLKQYGRPIAKYRSGREMPAGFEKLPRACCLVHMPGGEVNCVVDTTSWDIYGMSGAEYWEYAEWPRCLIYVADGEVQGIVTRPARKDDAVSIAKTTTKAATPPSGPKGSVADDNTAVPTDWVRIVNRSSGLHLATGGSDFPKAEVIQIEGRRPNTGEPRPGVWRIEPSPNLQGFFKIRNQSSDLCLAIKNRSGEPGAEACQVADGERGAGALWSIEPLPDGFWRLTSRSSRLSLGVSGSLNRSSVRQSPFREEAPEQQWRLEPVSTTANEKKRRKPREEDHTAKVIPKESPQSHMGEKKPPNSGGGEEPALIAAPQLWQEYGSNTLAADAKYKEGLLMLGSVHSINKARDGRYLVAFTIFLGGDSLTESEYAILTAQQRKWWAEGYPPNVICYLAKGAEQAFADVEKGTTIRVRAKAIGTKRTDEVKGGYIVELEDGVLVK